MMNLRSEMMPEDDIELFRKRWWGEFGFLKGYTEGGPHRYWEAAAAYSELKQKDALDYVLPVEEDPLSVELFEGLMQKVVRELRAHKRCADNFPGSNQCFNDGLAVLSSSIANLRKPILPDAPVKLEIENILARSAHMLESQQQLLELQSNSYFENLLLASPEERKTWKPSNRYRAYRKPPKELAEWQRHFDNFRYPEKLTRRIDLDFRIQVRLALILILYLDLKNTGISLTTISRLVVLIYICGDLATENNDELQIRGTQKPLTVQAVLERLDEALETVAGPFRGD